MSLMGDGRVSSEAEGAEVEQECRFDDFPGSKLGNVMFALRTAFRDCPVLEGFLAGCGRCSANASTSPMSLFPRGFV